MAYNENVQLEFSLDQKETYLSSGLNKKAEEYTNLFRYKREALIIAGEFDIQSNVFDKEKYDELLNTRGIVYAQRYKRFFILKKEILRIKDFLGFTKELGDDNVVIDDDLKKEDDDEITPPNVENPGTEPEIPEAPEEHETPEAPEENEPETKEETADEDIETLRQKYFEKFGKEVAKGYKNNIERIKKKLL